jgi:hypothetical protein
LWDQLSQNQKYLKLQILNYASIRLYPGVAKKNDFHGLYMYSENRVFADYNSKYLVFADYNSKYWVFADYNSKNRFFKNRKLCVAKNAKIGYLRIITAKSFLRYTIHTNSENRMFAEVRKNRKNCENREKSFSQNPIFAIYVVLGISQKSDRIFAKIVLFDPKSDFRTHFCNVPRSIPIGWGVQILLFR